MSNPRQSIYDEEREEARKSYLQKLNNIKPEQLDLLIKAIDRVIDNFDRGSLKVLASSIRDLEKERMWIVDKANV